MYCGECGTKNNSGDRFCAECGAPLEQVVEQQNNSTVINTVTPRKPMSKKTKIIILVAVLVVGLLGGVYKVGSDLTNPKAIAKDYIEASINQDGGKLYKYLEIEGDKTFVSKKIFTELLKENNTQASTIENYTITDVEYGDGKLTAKVNFTYTMKDSSSEKESAISLTKQKDKKFLIFDNWKIADLTVSSATMEEYTIKVAKGATVTYAGVKLTDKYLDKDKSTEKLDVYVLPQVFTTKTKIKAVLSNGIEIEDEVTPSSYYSTYTVSFDEDNLTDSAKEKITNKSKDVLTTIYTNAIARKTFSEIKSNFEHGSLDLTSLETSYTDLVSDLEGAYNLLTSISFTTITISDLELDDDGNLEVEVKANYNYTVQYENLLDEVKIHEDTDYSRMTLVFSYEKDEYHLVSVEDLETYFSRY